MCIHRHAIRHAAAALAVALLALASGCTIASCLTNLSPDRVAE